MKYLLACLFIWLPFSVSAEEINAGFVQGLWYSSDEIIEGVPLRIYAALRNNTDHDLIGTVRFLDNGKRIGSAPITALSGRLVETWIDWTPTYGDHSLSVSLENAELHVIGGDVIKAEVSSTTMTDALKADYDTDKDGIGNEKDPDDDNDDVSDEEERARGSNPLVANPRVTEIPLEPTPEETVPSTTPEVPEDGLEKFLDAGVADTLLSNVTTKVENAKQSLNAYREARNEKINDAQYQTEGGNGSTATITRSRVETKSSGLGIFVGGFASLGESMWTFVLWGTSRVLAHPAIIQVALLLGILYMFYRTMRRLARRPF